MGIFLNRVERRGVSLENPNVPLSDGFTLLEALGGGQTTAAGLRMNADKAMTLSAWWAGVTQIVGTVGALKLKLYRRLEDGGKVEFMDHPVWDLLRVRANPDMTAVTYRETGQGHLLNRGNAISEIVRNGNGQPVELWPLPPHRVERMPGFYRVHLNSGKHVDLPDDRVLHVVGLTLDGAWGVSPVTMARESLALGLAAERYGSAFYGQGSIPAGFLTAQGVNKPEGIQNVKRQWEGSTQGEKNWRRVPVMPGQIEWHAVGMSAEDSQFLESRKFQVEEIARWLNIPPHKIRQMDRSTFTNIEHQNIEYIQDTIEPWLARWEQAMNAKLLSESERRAGLFVEFNVDARLRGDTEKRSGFYTVLFQNGAITPNEIRAKENLNPIDGGDQAFVQLNMVPLDKAGELPEPVRERLLLAAAGQSVEPAKEQRSVAGRLRLLTVFTPMLLDAMGRVVRGEQRDVRKALADAEDLQVFLRALVAYYFDVHPEFMLRMLDPVLRPLARAVAEEARDEMGSERPVDVTAFTDFYMTDAVTRYSASSRSILTEAVQAREFAEAPEAVDEVFTLWTEGNATTRTRAEQVADREVNQLSNAVARTVFGLLGAVALKWVTVGDTCPFCRAMSGRTVGIQDPFFGSGQDFQPEGADVPLKIVRKVLHPPLHRGCDCYVTVA